MTPSRIAEIEALGKQPLTIGALGSWERSVMPYCAAIRDLLAELRERETLLRTCWKAIESLEPDALGYVENHDHDGGPTCWPLRDELSRAIRAALEPPRHD